jgi:hypothetical protein
MPASVPSRRAVCMPCTQTATYASNFVVDNKRLDMMWSGIGKNLFGEKTNQNKTKQKKFAA